MKLLGTLKLPGVFRHIRFGWLAGILVVIGIAVGLSAHGATDPGQTLWRDPAADPVSDPALTVAALPSLSGLVKKLEPAVVNIQTTQVIKTGGQFFQLGPGTQIPGLEDFFRKQNPFGGPEPKFAPPGGRFKRSAQGSGFIINADGYIITNHHVVADASEIKVILSDERTLEAKVVGSDPKTDIALLKVEPADKLPVVTLGDSDKLEVGDWVVAIGNPFGLGHTVTSGIISGKDRVIGQGPYDDFLQTDASINPGNSGGPLFNLAGEVVGINTAIVAVGSGVGFAVPVNLAKGLLPQLRTEGKVIRGWLGVGIQDLTGELAETFQVKAGSGVLVSQVFNAGPAERAGIRAGDIVLAIEGQPVRDARQLTGRIAALPPGRKVDIQILREGEKKSLAVQLGEREEGEAQALGRTSQGQPRTETLGMNLAPLTPETARRLGVDEQQKGLIVESVDGAGQAAGIIEPGDIILEANHTAVSTLEQLQGVLDRAGQKASVLLRIQRNNSQIFVVVKR
jgi:serine protease Do